MLIIIAPMCSWVKERHCGISVSVHADLCYLLRCVITMPSITIMSLIRFRNNVQTRKLSMDVFLPSLNCIFGFLMIFVIVLHPYYNEVVKVWLFLWENHKNVKSLCRRHLQRSENSICYFECTRFAMNLDNNKNGCALD